MVVIKRKNSLWHLYGIIGFLWTAYGLLVLVGNQVFDLVPILILALFSTLIIFSQWSSTIEVNFSNDFLIVQHYLKSHSKKYDYTKIKSVEHVFTRVYGRRLIFHCSDNLNNSSEFTIYNPDNELLEFVSSHIKTYKNLVS